MKCLSDFWSRKTVSKYKQLLKYYFILNVLLNYYIRNLCFWENHNMASHDNKYKNFNKEKFNVFYGFEKNEKSQNNQMTII